MNVRSARIVVLVLIGVLQFVQVAPAFRTLSPGPCCCRGATCPMKMHCAGSSCQIHERAVSFTGVRAVVPVPVVVAGRADIAVRGMVAIESLRDGFIRLPEEPPRSSRMVW
jgi:hypothetical protein